MKETEPYQKQFTTFEAETHSPAWISPLRKAGMDRFAELGFPTLSDEDWRFTNVAGIAKLPFRPVLAPAACQLTRETIETFTFGRLPAHRLVFVDGHHAPLLSDFGTVPNGVEISSLAAALCTDSEPLRQHLARHASTERQAFTALNTAFFQDGAFIRIPDRVTIETPIHLLFIATGKTSGATLQPRILVLAGKHSQATILESYVSLADAGYFTNAVTELILEDAAIIEHCKFQDESLNASHIAAVHAHLGRAANLAYHSVATGAHLSRNNIRTVLAGEGVECVLNGLYLTKGNQLADHHMVVEHAEPHCNSHEYFNGILDGRSKGVFHGRILVRQPAQKTDAKQTNKNLLLSEDATIDTKPQLEIYADDVKCTHGATIGQLNEESIFYLRARGIGMETARRMLIHAFAGEIIERIRHSGAREELDKLVWDRLEANPHVAQPH